MSKPQLSERNLWYRDAVAEHERAVVSPMGTDRERAERSAIEIARDIYRKRHGVILEPKFPAVCQWVTNRHGNRVIRFVAFRGANLNGAPIELPGWNGGRLAAPEHQPALFK